MDFYRQNKSKGRIHPSTDTPGNVHAVRHDNLMHIQWIAFEDKHLICPVSQWRALHISDIVRKEPRIPQLSDELENNI
jgi:hypothetical protein